MIPSLGSINLGSFNHEWFKFYLLEHQFITKGYTQEQPHGKEAQGDIKVSPAFQKFASCRFACVKDLP